MKSKTRIGSDRKEPGWLSKLFFWWLNGTVWSGYKGELNTNSIAPVLPEDEAEELCSKTKRCFESRLERNSKKGATGVLKCVIWKLFALQICMTGCIKLVQDCAVRIAIPMSLAYLIRYFNGQTTSTIGIIAAAGIIHGQIIGILMEHSFFLHVEHLGMKIRLSLTTLVYQKILKLKLGTNEGHIGGFAMNLVANDLNRLDNVQHVHVLWVGVIQVAITVGILWSYFGPFCLTGLLILFLHVPLQGFLGKVITALRKIIVVQTDERVRLMKEILRGIRAIKIYCWELVFTAKAEEARGVEMESIKALTWVRSLNWSLYYTSTKLAIFATVTSYVWWEHSLSAESVFVAVALYNNIRITVTLLFPLALVQLADVLISIGRIEDFLNFTELTVKSSQEASSEVPKSDNVAISCKNVVAGWTSFSLKANVNMDKGKCYAVIGPVGSGKSTFLKILLKEVELQSGTVLVNGSVSYASQEAWIFNGTIKENILFGNVYDEKRYQEVVSACQLTRDLELLAPMRDSTFVGDCGTSLSGGQKARINLARAVYAKATVYILDDPLSAVDANVARGIFDKCVNGLLKHSTRLLVTHQTQFLSKVDGVLNVDDGEVTLLDDIKCSKIIVEPAGSGDPVASELSTLLVESTAGNVQQVLNDPVPFSVFCRYLRCGSSWFSLTCLVILNLLTQGLHTGSDYWLQTWCRSHQEVSKFSKSRSEAGVYWYSLIIGLLFVFSMLRTLGFFRVCLASSKVLYRNMVSSVILTKMKFFEEHSVGQILNRFTKDTDIMDDALPQTCFETIEICLNVLGIVTLVCIVSPFILIPAIVLMIVFYCFFVVYVRSARLVKRMEAEARSPIYTHVSSTIHGLETIRAHQGDQFMTQTFFNSMNSHSRLWYLTIVMTRWIALWLDLVCVVFVAAVIGILMAVGANGALAGMTISSVMYITNVFNWGIRQASTVEMQMVSVERILEFVDSEPEGVFKAELEKRPHADWPSKGTISLSDVHVSAGEARILKNVCLNIRHSEKIGVVGRTGAGKTSLVNTLLRLIESEGSITIDGENVRRIGLHDLRSKISVIPQDPFLFRGTLRENLCLEQQFDDGALWNALEAVGLASHFADKSAGLSTEFVEGGHNFSVGQRQLFCLARSILQGNNILILDEATANVDFMTDQLVQKTIRETFKDCTVITIAHRLFTVMDCDRIVVMDMGEVKEFGSPTELLQIPNGILASMVQQTGDRRKFK